MGRKKKNNNKNKGGNKKSNPNNKSEPDTSAHDLLGSSEQSYNEKFVKDEVVVGIKNNKDEVIASSVENSTEPSKSHSDITATALVENSTDCYDQPQQTEGRGHRSLRDEFENRQRNTSSEGSISSSLERELVQELENVIGPNKQDLPLKTVIPKLDLNFLDESGSDSAQGTLGAQTLDNTLSSTLSLKNGAEKLGKKNDNRGGLTYSDIKTQSSPVKAEDQESGIGTVACSSNNDEKISNCQSTDLPAGSESRLEHNEDASSDQNHNDHGSNDQNHNDHGSNDQNLNDPSSNDQNVNITRPESRMMFYDRSLPDSAQTSITDLPGCIENRISDSINSIYQEKRPQNNLTDSNSTFSRESPYQGIGTEYITVSAYVSEPNLATYLRKPSPSIVEDTTSDDGYVKHRYSGNSTPRSFADMSSNVGSLEIIAASGVANFVERPVTRCEDRDMVFSEYDLDSSLDTLPLAVKFSNQGTSLFDEIKASEEDLHTETIASKKETCQVEKQEKTKVSANQRFKDEERMSDIGSALESARTGISKASSIKEDDNMSNAESITDYGPSTSEGSKTFSDKESVIERIPFHMQSAPALLEAQQLEKNYREFLSNSDISQENVEQLDDTLENMAAESNVNSENILEQLSQMEYKICYDMHEQQAEHPGQVYFSAMGDGGNDDLNAGFIMESSMDSVTETSHNVEIMHDAKDIIQDREHVSMVLSNLNQEIESLRAENKNLYGEMTMYRNSGKQYKGKAESMDGYIKKLRSHVKSLEIQMAEINSSKQNMKNSFTMTEQMLLLNTSSQVEPVTYDGHMQTELITSNIGCQIGNYAVDNQFLSTDCATSTDDLLNACNTSGSSNSLSRPTRSVSPIRVQTEMEGDERKKSSLKATDMLDRLIKQMANIAGNETDDATSLEEFDTPEKWRCIVMAPIETRNDIIRLQKSLATAADQLDGVNALYKGKEVEWIQKTEELDMKLKDNITAFDKAREDSETWQMKYEGDHTEMKVLRDKLSVMEKDFMLSQMDKEQFKGEVDKMKSKVSDVKDSAAVNSLEKDAEKVNLEKKLVELEEDKKNLQEELLNVAQNKTTDTDKISELETSLRNTEEQRDQLENEVKLIREEYQTLQRAIQSMEKAFYLNTDEPITDPKKLSLITETRLSELKKHVFDIKPVKRRAKSTESLVSNHSSSASIHDDIIQQSELVLDVLRKSGDLIEDEQKEEQLVDWEQVKTSIENQLNGIESTENTEETEAKAETQDNNNTAASIEDPDIKEHLSELASAISTDLGVKVNISVEDISKIITKTAIPEGNLQLDNKETQIMELERLNRDYEQMRKKRLALLVRTYTGNEDIDRSRSRNAKFAWDEPSSKDIPQSKSLFAKSLDSQEWKSQNGASTNGGFKRHPLTSLRPDYVSGSLSRPLENNSVLRESQEELNNLLSKSPSRVPRVSISKSVRSHNIVTANSSESPTPYSYRLKREIYPHKKGYMSADKFYEAAEQLEEEYYGDNTTQGFDDRNVQNGDYADGYYDDERYRSYPDDRRNSYGEYSDGGHYPEDPYYYGEESYLPSTAERKEAVVKLRARLLKKKRLAAKEKARRSPSPTYDDPYDTDNLLHSDPVATHSQTWSPQDWNLENKSDLNSIKKSIRDYSTHLRTKYSGAKDSLKELDSLGIGSNSGVPETSQRRDDSYITPSEYSSLYNSATKYDTSIMPESYKSSLGTDLNFNGATSDVSKYAKPKEKSSLFADSDKYSAKPNEKSSLFDNTLKTNYVQPGNQYLVDKYLTSEKNKNYELSTKKASERSISPTRHTSTHISNSQSSSLLGVGSRDVKSKETTRTSGLQETLPTYSSSSQSHALLKSTSDDLLLPDTRSEYPKSSLGYTNYSSPSSSKDSLLKGAVNVGPAIYNSYSSSSNDSILKDSGRPLPKSSSTHSTYSHSPLNNTHLKSVSSTSSITRSSVPYSTHAYSTTKDTIAKDVRSASPHLKTSGPHSTYHSSSLLDSKTDNTTSKYVGSYSDVGNKYTKDTDITSRNNGNYSSYPESSKYPKTEETARYATNSSPSYRERDDQNYKTDDTQRLSQDKQRSEKEIYVAYQEKDKVQTDEKKRYGNYRNPNEKYDVKFVERSSSAEKPAHGNTDLEIYMREMEHTVRKKYDSQYKSDTAKSTQASYSAVNESKRNETSTKSSSNAPSSDNYTYKDNLRSADGKSYDDKRTKSDVLKEIVLRDYEHVDGHLQQDKKREDPKYDSYDRRSTAKTEYSSKYDRSNARGEPSHFEGRKDYDTTTDKYYVSRSRTMKSEDKSFDHMGTTSKNDYRDRTQNYEHKSKPSYNGGHSSSIVDARSKSPVDKYITYRASPVQYSGNTSANEKQKVNADGDSKFSKDERRTESQYNKSDYYKSNQHYTSSTTNKPEESYNSYSSSRKHDIRSDYNEKKPEPNQIGKYIEKKPELSREYLESINRASPVMDSHMLEMKQRASSITEDRRVITPDDASSVAGSSISDADFVVVSSGDIVRRKSKSAKKFDKARNTELQMKTFEGNYEDFDDGIYDDSREDDQNSETTTGLSWAEPRRHFGVRDSVDSSDLQWKEPKVFTTKDMKKLGYVNTGASNLTASQQLDSRRDDEWFRNSNEEDLPEDKSKQLQDTNSKAANDVVNEYKIISSKGSEPTSKLISKNHSPDTSILREGESSDPEKQKRRVHWNIENNKSDEEKYSINKEELPANRVQPNERLNTGITSNIILAVKSSILSSRNEEDVRTRNDISFKSNTIANFSQAGNASPVSDNYKLNGSESNSSTLFSMADKPSKDKDPDLSQNQQDYRIHNENFNKNELPHDKQDEDKVSKTFVKEILRDEKCDQTINTSHNTSQDEKASPHDMSSESNDADSQNDTLPTDPYERQQLISDIIQKYTKDMDQSYLMQRDQTKKASGKKHENKNTKSLSPSREQTVVSTSSKFANSNPRYESVDNEEESVFPLQTIHEKRSRIPVASRSPSRSPSHSRRSSVESETGRTRIPVSRSLSREKLEYLTSRSPASSRRGSTDSEQKISSIPVKAKRTPSVESNDSATRNSNNNDVSRRNLHTEKGNKTPSSCDVLSGNEIDNIMKKYTMFNDEWKKTQPITGKLKELVD